MRKQNEALRGSETWKGHFSFSGWRQRPLAPQSWSPSTEPTGCLLSPLHCVLLKYKSYSNCQGLFAPTQNGPRLLYFGRLWFVGWLLFLCLLARQANSDHFWKGCWSPAAYYFNLLWVMKLDKNSLKLNLYNFQRGPREVICKIRL